MQSDYTLLIVTPMQEENVIVHEMLTELGYAQEYIAALEAEKKLCIHETGMGAINTMNFIYNVPHIFEKNTVDVLLVGFAGALSPDIATGDSCQVGNISHFSHIQCQEAGDFEIISTPSAFFSEHLQPPSASLALPHIALSPTPLKDNKNYNLISVPGLLQGETTKNFLYSQGIELVDMEAFALAAALAHRPTKNIQLDIIRVITDSLHEKFQFEKLETYKDYLRKSTLIHEYLQKKMANFA